MQERTDHDSNNDVVWNEPGTNNIGQTAADTGVMLSSTVPSACIRYGPSTSFCEVGKQLAESFTLNRRQTIAFRLLCRQLDRVKRAQRGLPQLCQYIGGEGGTGKSRIINAVVELFASRGISHRLLITATAGAPAAGINGITIHSACNFSKEISRSFSRSSDELAIAYFNGSPHKRAGQNGVAGQRYADHRRSQHARCPNVARRGRATSRAAR
jgi:hypothetical protein